MAVYHFEISVHYVPTWDPNMSVEFERRFMLTKMCLKTGLITDFRTRTNLFSCTEVLSETHMA
jgi:hypothetical protein